MKKNLLSLSLLAIVLAGCSNSSPTSLPSGKEIDKTTGKQKMQQAIEATEESVTKDNGKLKIGLSGGSLKVKADTEIATTSYSTKTSFEVSASDIVMLLSAEGLNGSDAKDYHAHAQVGFKASMKAETNSSLASNTEERKEKEYKADAYQDSEYAYLDFSNENTYDIISSMYKNKDLHGGKIKSKVSDSSYMDYESIRKEVESLTDYIEKYLEKDEDGKYMDHGKDTYSYSVTLDGKDLNEEESDFDASTSSTAKVTFKEKSSLSLAFIGSTTTGINSLGIDAKVFVDSAASASSSYVTGKTTFSVEIDMSMKFEFDMSSNITVDKPVSSEYTSID